MEELVPKRDATPSDHQKDVIEGTSTAEQSTSQGKADETANLAVKGTTPRLQGTQKTSETPEAKTGVVGAAADFLGTNAGKATAAMGAAAVVYGAYKLLSKNGKPQKSPEKENTRAVTSCKREPKQQGFVLKTGHIIAIGIVVLIIAIYAFKAKAAPSPSGDLEEGGVPAGI